MRRCPRCSSRRSGRGRPRAEAAPVAKRCNRAVAVLSATDFSGADIMALEKEAQRQPSLPERPRPPAARTRAGGNDATADVEAATLRSGGAVPQDRLRGKLRVVDLPEAQRNKPPE